MSEVSSVPPLFLGNWKMNMLLGETREFAEQFLKLFRPERESDTGIAAPFTSLSALAESFAETSVLSGAQNVHWLDSGAHTGEISVPMLKELNVDFAILGHSERRAYYGEKDEEVALRTKAAIEGGLRAVVCIGETREDYEAGRTDSVVLGMLEGSTSGLSAEHLGKLIIAYEPVWAIGTGLAATPEIASRVHNKIREQLEKRFGSQGSAIPLLYGGSTKPDNIAELMAQKNINGALVGGASLKAAEFNELIVNGREGNARA